MPEKCPMSHAECPTVGMSLNELIDSVGITRIQLAKLMNVSRKTVTRLGDEVTPDVLKAVEAYKCTDMASETIPVPVVKLETIQPGTRHKEPEDYTMPEMAHLCSERKGTPDWMVAAAHGLKTYEFKAMIANLVAYCAKAGTTAHSLRQQALSSAL